MVFADGNVSWAAACAQKGIRCEQVTHQQKQFTKPVTNVKRPASNLSTIAGTQSLDRAWQELKNWLPPKLVAFSKKNGHTLMCDRVEELLFQWVWRKHVLPCSPKEFLKQFGHTAEKNLTSESKKGWSNVFSKQS